MAIGPRDPMSVNQAALYVVARFWPFVLMEPPVFSLAIDLATMSAATPDFFLISSVRRPGWSLMNCRTLARSASATPRTDFFAPPRGAPGAAAAGAAFLALLV